MLKLIKNVTVKLNLLIFLIIKFSIFFCGKIFLFKYLVSLMLQKIKCLCQYFYYMLLSNLENSEKNFRCRTFGMKDKSRNFVSCGEGNLEIPRFVTFFQDEGFLFFLTFIFFCLYIFFFLKYFYFILKTNEYIQPSPKLCEFSKFNNRFKYILPVF